MSTVAVVGCRHMKILLLVHSEVRVIDYVRYYQEAWRNGDIAQYIYNYCSRWGVSGKLHGVFSLPMGKEISHMHWVECLEC